MTAVDQLIEDWKNAPDGNLRDRIEIELEELDHYIIFLDASPDTFDYFVRECTKVAEFSAVWNGVPTRVAVYT